MKETGENLESKIKIIHIIVGLNAGGAERMLVKLLANINREEFDVSVVSMTDKSLYGPLIEEMGIPVYTLNMKRGLPSIRAILKAKNIVADADIIQTWMYHADFLGFILSKIVKKARLIWGIRQSNLEMDKNKKSTIMLAKINSLLSKKVDKIISCSIKAQESHVQFGYDEKRIQVIPNGFEIERYNKNSYNNNYINSIFHHIPNDTMTIVHIGRWDVQKDHDNFLNALKKVIDQNPNVVALMCGLNINEENIELMSLIDKYKLHKHVLLLDVRNDIAEILSSSEIFVSSSSGEGFPNVIGEAMACKIPCVVTDVGDSAFIVGDYGVVVPRKNSEALAKGILKVYQMTFAEKEQMVCGARKRVEENFEIKKIVKKFESIYLDLNGTR